MKKGFQRISPGVYRNATGQVRMPQQGQMPGRRMGQQQMPMQPTPRPMAPQMGMQGNPAPRPMAPQWQLPQQQMPPGVMPGFQPGGPAPRPMMPPPMAEQEAMRRMQQGAGPTGQPFDARTMSPQQLQQWGQSQGHQSFGAQPGMQAHQVQPGDPRLQQMLQQKKLMQNRAMSAGQPVGLLSQPPKV